MHSRFKLSLPAAVAAVILVAGIQTRATGAPSQPNNEPGPERFTANAVNLNGARVGVAQVIVDIKRWSTDGQRDQLLNVLRTKGEQALLDALQKQPVVGTIRTPDSLAYDLHYARQQPWDDGGQQIFIATDRPIQFWEARNAPRSLNYPFTVIQMRVKGSGTGEGKMSVATRVIPEGNQIVLENYDAQPVLLEAVKDAKK